MDKDSDVLAPSGARQAGLQAWQPISTAPKVPQNGRPWEAPRLLLLSLEGRRIDIGKWQPNPNVKGGGGWKDDHYRRIYEPTHWMLLPASPPGPRPAAADGDASATGSERSVARTQDGSAQKGEPS